MKLLFLVAESRMRISFIFIWFYGISLVNCANILFYVGLSSYSHRIAVWPLVTSLAERGHNVTFMTIYPPKSPHPLVREFLPKEVEAEIKASPLFKFENILSKRIIEGRWGSLQLASRLPAMALEVCKLFVSSPAIANLINNSTFDLLVIDGILNECGLGLAYKFKAKHLYFGTTSLFSWWPDEFGFLPESSVISDLHLSFQYPMTFPQRVLSTLMPLYTYLHKIWKFYPQLEHILKTHLHLPNMPSIQDLQRNTSLVFVNSHYSEEFARSVPPMVISVGGIHLQSNESSLDQAIPEDMLKFMDESTGFFYVSFGSAAMISQTPAQLQAIFYTAFKNCGFRILWKWEGDRPADMPANVFTSNWMPQQFILAHPKLKAFITHGGRLSITEAIANAMPIIVFPLFAEQEFNSFRIERLKRGIRLEISTLTLGELEDALREITNNQLYKRNMVEAKRLFYDRQFSPLETAIWWTEYVIRQDDHSCLKPLSIEQSWFERRLLDVWALIAFVCSIAVYTCCYLIRVLVQFLFRLKKKNAHSKKHKLH